MSGVGFPVRDLDTGETWPSVNAAAKAIGVGGPTLHEAIKNHWKSGGRYLVYDTQDAYCACCKAKIAERRKLGPNFGSVREEVVAQIG